MIFKKRETISEIVLLRSSNKMRYYSKSSSNQPFHYLKIMGNVCYGIWVATVIFNGYLFHDTISFVEKDLKRSVYDF